jgi:hypothetical protein
MKVKKFYLIILLVTLIVSLISIKAIAVPEEGYIEILPEIRLSLSELRTLNANKIKKVNYSDSFPLIFFSGREKQGEYYPIDLDKITAEELKKLDLALEKHRVSVHFEDYSIFDIIAAKFNSKEILDRAFDWYRCGAYQVCLDPEDLAERRIGDRSAKGISPTGASILFAYKGYLFQIGCIHPPTSELSTKDMDLAENLTKLILEKVDGIK